MRDYYKADNRFHTHIALDGSLWCKTYMAYRYFKSNNHVVYSCKYHVVWCPKYRRKVLTEEVATRLSQIISQVCTEHEADVLELEIMPDHVHLLVECDPQFGIHKLVKLCKGRSSYLFVGKSKPSLSRGKVNTGTSASRLK